MSSGAAAGVSPKRTRDVHRGNPTSVRERITEHHDFIGRGDRPVSEANSVVRENEVVLDVLDPIRPGLHLVNSHEDATTTAPDASFDEVSRYLSFDHSLGQLARILE